MLFFVSHFDYVLYASKQVPISHIRNFCIIAHIDHGKSTLADKLLQLTGTVQMRDMKEQFLDNMDLERERGITIKLQAARMRFVVDNEPYCLNLIDTPGHVDFSYEASLLVILMMQGVEAQTLANVYLALENNLEVIPEGIGIMEILNAIVRRVPPPQENADRPLRALIFDSYYDPYRGVIVYFRVIDGSIKKGDRIYFMASGKVNLLDTSVYSCFILQVGYLSASIRTVADARVGDTITHFTTPMVFCGLFPVDADQYVPTSVSIFFLIYNFNFFSKSDVDYLTCEIGFLSCFEPETSSAMGFGFRCGFLGLLHMEIVQVNATSLLLEYNLTLITTAPSVVYRIECVNGDTIECSNPSLLPEPGKRKSIEEPYDYIGSLMELGQDRRGVFKEMNFISENRASISWNATQGFFIHLQMVGEFFDHLKSRSKGYASMEYSFIGYRESDLVKLDIQINGEPVEPLATIVHKDKACIGTKVIASEALSAIRKDVLAKCYGGDITRKKKLLRKQAEGKKRMKSIGRVEVPQEAFMAVLKLEKEVI
ncbi:unnamed protein product [Spirodela intermedia]|uniref:Tr-type G domain-containing protein n=1 Tax=Spirodela intermedia TaxID=51605 RepID=A0A7I8J568_SPIIN|nr:unnamed protein product [Spirodela intermedia]CAA6664915.1 unnamed protein product [Spirodela intermedia]